MGTIVFLNFEIFYHPDNDLWWEETKLLGYWKLNRERRK